MEPQWGQVSIEKADWAQTQAIKQVHRLKLRTTEQPI